MAWIGSIVAFLVGALVTVQAGSNPQLKQGFGTPMPALLVNYLLGFTVVLGCALIARVPWPAIGQVGRATLVSLAGRRRRRLLWRRRYFAGQ